MRRVKLEKLAYTRSGDKGDISNVGIMAFNKSNYEIIKTQLTPERIKEHYKDLVKGDVEIYYLPNLDAIQVVMHNALGGGATKTLRFDQTGKSMCKGIQSMEFDIE